MRKNKHLAALLAIFMVVLILTGTTAAWLGVITNSITTTVNGKLVVEYFHCGSGKIDDPFVITRPIHYYHMVEFFQRTTNLPVTYYYDSEHNLIPVQFGTEYLYFQIGCPMEQLRDPSVRVTEDENTEYYVFSYSDTGDILLDSNQLGIPSTNLNMAYYSNDNALMPIGTSEIPFVGQLDGKGLTVSNLNIKSTSTVNVDNGVGGLQSVNRSTCDIGIFGYLGEGKDKNNDGQILNIDANGDGDYLDDGDYQETCSIKNVYFDSATIDLSDVSNSLIESVIDGQPHNTSVHTVNAENLAYVGYIAGHIVLSSTCEDVYINNCSIIGGNAAFSGFGYFGCVENADGQNVTTLGQQVATLRAQGDDAGFGGSLDMNATYTRLNNMIGNPATTVRNITSEEVWIDEVNGTTEKKNIVYANANAQADGNTVYYYTGEHDGSYYMFRRSSNNNWTVVYLYGENTRSNTKTVTTYRLKNEFDEDSFQISVNGSYLNATTSGVSTGNNATDATIWQLDSSNHLNALLEESTRYNTYYLNASANGTLSVSTTPTTDWTNTSGHLTYSSGGRTWYLSLSNGTWRGYPFDSIISISIQGGTAFLGQSSSTSLAGSSGNHADWHYENGKLMTFINQTVYYLNAADGALSLGTNANSATSTWTINNDHTISYSDGNGLDWYLAYDGAWHCVPFLNGFVVKNGTDYLGYDGSSFIATTEANALHFAEDDGDIITYYNDTLYYLNASSGNLSLSASDPSITWTKGADTITYTDASNITWYLRCRSGNWDLFPSNTPYTIHSGTSYFGVNGTNLTLTNEAGSATWSADGGKLFTTVGGTIYYLVGSTDGSGTLSLTASRASGTDWNFTLATTGGSMTYSGGEETWYLYERGGSWAVAPSASATLISQNGSYLHASGTSAVDGTNEANATYWSIDGTNHIYTFYSGARRYLATNGTNVILSDSGTSVWTQNGNNTVTDGNGWYLIYDNGWKVYPSTSYVLIKDGTNYLSKNGTTGITNQTSAASASRWFTDGNKLFALDGSTPCYLSANTTALSITTDPANGTDFTYSDEDHTLSFTVNTDTYYVIYNSGWTVSQSYRTSSTIKASSGNYYLNASTTSVSTGTTAGTATQWFYDNNGHLYTEIGGDVYYLRAALETNNTYGSTNLTITATEGDATSFTFSGGNLSCSLNNQTYTLSLHNNIFKMVLCGHTYYTIRQETNSNNYLGLNGETAVSATQNDAVLWDFSSTGNDVTTTVSTLINGSTRYLSLNNSSITFGNSTELNYRRSGYYNNYHYNLRRSSGNYRYNYLAYSSNNWTVYANSFTTPSESYITITAVTFTATSLTFSVANHETTEDQTSLSATTAFSSVNALNNVTFTTASSGMAHSFEDVSENVSLNTPDSTNNIALNLGSKRRQHIEKTVETNVASGYPTYFPIRIPKSSDSDYDAQDTLKASQKNTGYIVSGGNFYDGSTDGTKVGDIRVSEYNISNISGSWSTTGLSVSKIRYGNNYLFLDDSDEDGTYVISNTTNANEANFWQYSNNKLFTVIGSETYWLTYDNGLKLSQTAGVNWTFSNNNRLAYNNNYIKYAGGAWVATANSVNLTLTLGTLGTVYTYDGTNHALTDAQKTDVYKQAALQLTQTLAGSNNVYGLHFMNAEITDSHITVAPKVSIFGIEHTDYELPEDSIDFNVVERGSISFFAGEYFTGNNAFFSLHQIIRYKEEDEEVVAGTKKKDDIKYIKAISEVYKHSTNGDTVNYIYKFSDNTFTNADGTYTGAVSLAEGYSNDPAFRISWITAPSGLSKNNNRLYFFQIPCNMGEYCLGSVSGKTGAYLVYLDIATNGGDTINQAISSEGNEITEAFKVEFRSSPDTVDYALLQFSVNAPADADLSKFKVTVNFDNSSETTSGQIYSSGLYTIDILNKTGADVTLTVFLCDNDNDVFNIFPYAYRIVYTNSSHTDTVFENMAMGENYWRASGQYNIPSSGDAVEMSYSA